MSAFYKILKADALGSPWTPSQAGAKPIQNFWCQVEGQDLPVSIGKQVPNVVNPGDQVYGDLVYAKSQSGNEYWKFKSQMVPEGVQRPASSPAQAVAQQATGSPQGFADQWAGQNGGDIIPKWALPLYNMVEYIYKEMKKMDADDINNPQPEPAPEPAKAEPVDPETQATLDNIFGKTEEE